MLKTKNLIMLLAVLFLTLLLPANTTKAVGDEATGFPFEYNKSLWNTRIDQAVAMKANRVFVAFPRGPVEFDKIQAGGPDPHKSAIMYAKSKGIKVSSISVLSWWGSGCSKNIACVDSFLQDFEWGLETWRPDGFEAEEFPSKDTSQAQLDNIYTRMRNIIDTKIAEGKLPADFQFGASWSSNDFLNALPNSGVDVAYLNSNHILDYVRPEFVVQTVPQAESLYNKWKAQFTTVDVRPTLYVTWTALKKACIANGYNGFNDKSCFNQGWLRQIEWAHTKGIGFFMYYINSYSISYIDPLNLYPGTTVIQKISNILSGASAALPPLPLPPEPEPSESVCPDGICDGTETDATCPEDCPAEPAPPTCTPSITCADYPFKCGANLFDGCDNILDCSGSCAAPLACNVSNLQCEVPPSAPTIAPILSATPSTDAVELRWTIPAGVVSGYKIYRDGILIKTISGLYFRDVPGDNASHSYEVSAYNSIGEGPKSAAVSQSSAIVPVTDVQNKTSLTDFRQLIANVFKWTLSIIGGLALLMIMLGGIMYMGSTGSEQKATSAKRAMTYALAGLVIILLAYTISYIVERIFM
ncbi:MAG: hypothetical protein WC788_02530 [Candidatus Paceibacterota bacterium]|jgi:hypothetical protein